MAFSNPASNTLNLPILQDLGASSETAVMDVGTRRKSTSKGREFQYVCFASSGVAAISGAPAVYSHCTAQIVVTSDISDTDTEGGAFAGVFWSDQAGGGGAANQVYLWIQTRGYVEKAHCEDAVAVGDQIGAFLGDYFESLEDLGTSKGTLYRAVAVAQASSSSCKADIIIL